uniref:Uncharacterized protein n=1 Tax=Meloidogyne hapla TaxID=6305 RepID=A0A1I8C096_MELHA
MEEEDHNIALTIQRKEILDMQTSQDQKTGEPSTRIGDEEEIDYNDYFENKEIEPFEWQRDLDHQIAEGSLSSRTQQTMEQQDFHQNRGSSSSHNHPGASIYTNQLWDSQYQPPFTHQNTSGIGESSSYQLLDPTYAPQPVVQPSQLQQHAPGIGGSASSLHQSEGSSYANLPSQIQQQPTGTENLQPGYGYGYPPTWNTHYPNYGNKQNFHILILFKKIKVVHLVINENED